ncbi:glutamate--cysteine ligase [Neiella sp. HB171785]|uniref:Glutamate--cysteine ligase n=1 Tax=Neiella litorisoli TaxID=2771431 RepID=A0A8J6UIW5_9GAMM|nr:glutamate--cysteine ligase [Neiella litorisoli]MBD1389298.1 glutamate--cysteine ligase [Neiella litorisoli]
MGQHFAQQSFTSADYRDFAIKLESQLADFRALLEQPNWGEGPCSAGAELEFYLLDAELQPKCCSEQLLALANDNQLTEELNQFNLEFNLPPVAFTGTPLQRIEQQVLDKNSALQQLAKTIDADMAIIGILPTLEERHLGMCAMSDRPRYHALTKNISELRGGPFQIDINGAEQLKMTRSDLTLEGANTSFQFHYRVSPSRFNDLYNAIQLVTPLALAMAGNSAYLLHRQLWHETRIALFKQSTDPRTPGVLDWQPSRVTLGQGWLQGGAYQLFAESVHLHKPLLPLVNPAGDGHIHTSSCGPKLEELRLHHGTIWSWNRAIYDPVDGGHLRIELRALPAGPTATDMLANIALIIGLAEGFVDSIQELTMKLPFNYVVHNFYRAAKHGLAAKFVWPDRTGEGLTEVPVDGLLEQMLPIAHRGLLERGIDASEVAYYLTLIEQRLAFKQTGATWQVAMTKMLERDHDRRDALRLMLQRYIELSASNTPVAQWSIG